MVEARRYTSGGKVLANTLCATGGEFSDEDTDSHKQDFSVAFGIPADSIEVERLDWDGEQPYYLAFPDPQDAIQRVPVEPSAPIQPTLEEQVSALTAIVAELAPEKLAASPVLSAQVVQG